MYTGLVHAHSGLRWLVLIFLVLALIYALQQRQGKTGGPLAKMPLLGLIFTHLQLLIGLALYFISPKVQFTADMMSKTAIRFYTVEHISLMLIAIILITLGYSRAKRKPDVKAKGKTTLLFYGIGLLLILISIPWPFRNLGAGWF
jgi:hypothetical protein